MVAPRPLTFFLFLTVAIFCTVCGSETRDNVVDLPKKIELSEGISVKFPESNNTDRVLSFELDTHREDNVEGRGKKKKLIEKFLPLFIMPFLIQSSIVPLFLGMLKFMLFKSLMVGKLALALIVLNAFRNQNSFKGRDAEMADVHYGYHENGMGDMGEYGAFIHK